MIVYIVFTLNIRALNLKVLNSLAEDIRKYESCIADRIIGTSLLLYNSTLNSDVLKFKERAS